MDYYIIRHNDGSYTYEGTATKEEVPPSDSHCFYIEAKPEYGVPFEGAVWDSVNKRFVESPGPSRLMPPGEFMELFEPDVQLSITKAATYGSTTYDADVAAFWHRMVDGGGIRLDHSLVAPGMAKLVDAGLITQQQSDEILGVSNE